MRILLADSGRAMRGGQWQTFYLLRELGRRGEEVRILAEEDGDLLRRARAEGLDAGPIGPGALWRWSKWADITHVQDARSHSLGCLLARSPLVVSRRVAFPPGRGPLSRWKYSRAKHYIAVSKYARAVLEHAGVAHERISVVHDGVPSPEVVPSWADRPLPFVAMRTGDPMKGDDLIAEAAALAGVEITWSDRIDEDLPRARVFVYVSRSEGLGSAALLAMANGTALIASRAGGLEEVVDSGRTGLLVENRPADIAGAMSRLAHDARFSQSLAAAGPPEVRRRFSLASMARATLIVYRKVIG